MKINNGPQKSVLFAVLIIVITSFSGACAYRETIKKSDIKYIGPGDVSNAAVGEIFFSYRLAGEGGKNKPGQSFDISVIRLNDREIIFKQVSYDKKGDKGELIPLQGVKTYTFPMTINKISFMDFTFVILSVREGRISYKRIR
ncbi:MAG: hypothetical protein OEV42_00730 [Deltaproteobacteria bacterium]|nr:hypothetical protein [Deltaproteobacteria bacterium]